ncbi:MAG: UDP-N-acetylglucosamine 4,6-dehydratase family protein, partial [Rhodobacterales bacterium]
GREPVKPNEELLKLKITGKVVLVTGAGGSIGSELCRQIILQKPKQLILYEINEFSLYNVEQEFDKIEMPHVEILPVLGSVRDRKRFQNVVKHFSVQTIYHAAAYKHVPLVEYNNSEGVLNNTFGTLIAAEVALAEKVETFVLISTDKAVRPTNTMGATKRIAELVLQALSKQESSTCFTMVRFGNVLDSSGSVIPLFKQQIKNGGPVTVTNANMVRYFMTIPEAVELVVQAGAMGKGGDVFVLDMGEPVRIYDLATKMIQLSGLQVLDEDNLDGDIEIKCIGLRPGEKLYEELLVGDNISQTDSLLIMRAEESMLDWEDLKPILDQLNEAINNSDQEKVRELLIEAVPEFKPQCDIADLLF